MREEGENKGIAIRSSKKEAVRKELVQGEGRPGVWSSSEQEDDLDALLSSRLAE